MGQKTNTLIHIFYGCLSFFLFACLPAPTTVIGHKINCNTNMNPCHFELSDEDIFFTNVHTTPIRFNQGLSLNLTSPNLVHQAQISFLFTPKDMAMTSFTAGPYTLSKNILKLPPIYFPVCTEKVMLWDVEAHIISNTKPVKTWRLLWQIEVMK